MGVFYTLGEEGGVCVYKSMEGWYPTLSDLYESLYSRYGIRGTPMLTLPDGIFPLACDKINSKTQQVCKQYGFVLATDLGWFVRSRKRIEEKCLYTLVNRGQPCDGCIDIDVHMDPDDDHHVKLCELMTPKFLCEKLFLYVQRALETIGRDRETFRLVVLDSSSMTKISFHVHVVFTNTCFASLADMGRFMWLVFSLVENDTENDTSWAYIIREHGSARLLQQSGSNRMQTLIFDTAIYTRGRCFRLPQCSKLRVDGSLGPPLQLALVMDSTSVEPIELSDDDLFDHCRITRFESEITSDQGFIVCKENVTLRFLTAIELNPTSDSRFLRYEEPLCITKWSDGVRIVPSQMPTSIPTLGLKISKSIRVLPLVANDSPDDDNTQSMTTSCSQRSVFPFSLFFQ